MSFNLWASPCILFFFSLKSFVETNLSVEFPMLDFADCVLLVQFNVPLFSVFAKNWYLDLEPLSDISSGSFLFKNT